jgi:hypothetical protein
MLLFHLGIVVAGLIPPNRYSDTDKAPILTPVACFHRGVVSINESLARQPNGHLADTYLSVKGWGKGLVWINGFNLVRMDPLPMSVKGHICAPQKLKGIRNIFLLLDLVIHFPMDGSSSRAVIFSHSGVRQCSMFVQFLMFRIVVRQFSMFVHQASDKGYEVRTLVV